MKDQAAPHRYNADVNSLAIEIAFAEKENYRASSPLCQAAMNGYTEVARLMVDKGANTTLGDIQPIVVAAKHFNTDIVRLLLEHGTDPNLWDVTGYTAMEWAKYNQDLNLMNLLLSYNATQ